MSFLIFSKEKSVFSDLSPKPFKYASSLEKFTKSNVTSKDQIIGKFINIKDKKITRSTI